MCLHNPVKGGPRTKHILLAHGEETATPFEPPSSLKDLRTAASEDLTCLRPPLFVFGIYFINNPCFFGWGDGSARNTQRRKPCQGRPHIALRLWPRQWADDRSSFDVHSTFNRCSLDFLILTRFQNPTPPSRLSDTAEIISTDAALVVQARSSRRGMQHTAQARGSRRGMQRAIIAHDCKQPITRDHTKARHQHSLCTRWDRGCLVKRDRTEQFENSGRCRTCRSSPRLAPRNEAHSSSPWPTPRNATCGWQGSKHDTRRKHPP